VSEDSHAFVDLVARHVSAITGQRAASVRQDILGLALEQAVEVQVEVAPVSETRSFLDRLDIDAQGIGVVSVSRAELLAGQTVVDARGKRPYLVPGVVIEAPPMTDDEQEGWLTLFALHDQLPRNWSLVGGQMVHLHCWQRGRVAPRVTTDSDLFMDIRASRTALNDVSQFLAARGFTETGMSPDGIAHRWNRDAVIELLIPEGSGRLGALARTVTGGHNC